GSAGCKSWSDTATDMEPRSTWTPQHADENTLTRTGSPRGCLCVGRHPLGGRGAGLMPPRRSTLHLEPRSTWAPQHADESTLLRSRQSAQRLRRMQELRITKITGREDVAAGW